MACFVDLMLLHYGVSKQIWDEYKHILLYKLSSSNLNQSRSRGGGGDGRDRPSLKPENPSSHQIPYIEKSHNYIEFYNNTKMLIK